MKHKNKIGTMFLICILALSGVGITYAGFSDTLKIKGNVNTARVQFEDFEYTGTWVYKVWGCNDAPDNEIIVTHESDYTPEGEYPGCQYQLYSYAKTLPGTDGSDVDVVFDNLMPGVDYVADFHFKVGTIPVLLDQLDYNFQGDSELIELVDLGFIWGCMYTDTGKTLEVGSQIHPDETVTLELHINIPQNNEYQGKSGSFSCDLGIVQWTDPCGFVPNPKGSIEVRKITDPSGGSDFQFTVTGPDTDEGFVLNDGSYWTVGDLDLGTYTVSETDLPDGWTLDNIEISGDYSSESFADDSVSFELHEGHVIVTFNNEEESQGCQEETAWAGDTVGSGNSWWYYFDTDDGNPQTITAGQNNNAGTVTVSDPDNGEVTITISLTGGWELQDVEDSVKIQGYNEIPSSRPSGGQFGYKGKDLVVTVDSFQYYAIHLDVQYCS